MKTAFVWDRKSPAVLSDTDAIVGTHYLSQICDIDYLWWGIGESIPDISEYECLIVNLFAGMDHVELIKILRPDIYVIALPDNAFEQVFTHASASDTLFLQQLQAADTIGYISESNRQFYSAMFPDKPTVKIPMPIGQDAFFEDIRTQAKEDFIITCDHLILDKDGKPLLDASSIQNVAACAAIQRATGLRVVYVNAAPKTPEYAKFCGLEATYTDYLHFATYAELAARARLGVDAYALHGFGRNTLMYAAAGTPAIGSEYTEFTMLEANPWDSEEFAKIAYSVILDHPKSYPGLCIDGVNQVASNHSFAACRKQMTALLDEVETWRLPLTVKS